MTSPNDHNRFYRGSVYRLLSGLFGVFLTCLGIYVVFFGVVHPLLNISIGLFIALLGFDTLWSALQSKQSWLARLGPFI